MSELYGLIVEAGRAIIKNGVLTIVLFLAVLGLIFTVVHIKNDMDSKVIALYQRIDSCEHDRATGRENIVRLEMKVEGLIEALEAYKTKRRK